MGWWYKPPQNFPAAFLSNLRQAALQPDEPLPIESFGTEAEAKALAEHYRYFRWAIRTKPEAMIELSNILETFDVRTAIKPDEVGYVLQLTAKPTKLSEFIRLNPDLADQILPECQ